MFEDEYARGKVRESFVFCSSCPCNRCLLYLSSNHSLLICSLSPSFPLPPSLSLFLLPSLSPALSPSLHPSLSHPSSLPLSLSPSLSPSLPPAPSLSQRYNIMVNFLLMDSSILLPPTGTPLTGIDFTKRLPCGETERAQRVSYSNQNSFGGFTVSL